MQLLSRRLAPGWATIWRSMTVIVMLVIGHCAVLAAPVRTDDNQDGPEVQTFVNPGTVCAVTGLLGIVLAFVMIAQDRRRTILAEQGWSTDYRPELLATEKVQPGISIDGEPAPAPPVVVIRSLFTPKRVGALVVSGGLLIGGGYYGTATFIVAQDIETGRIQIAAKNYYSAELSFRAALKLNPNNPQVHMFLGDSLMRQGKVEQAIPELSGAVKVDKPDPHAYVMLGDCLQYSNRLDEAEEQYRSAIQINPQLSDAFLKLSACLEKENRPGDAVKALRVVVELDRRNVRAHARLGKRLMDMGFTDEGLGHLEQASALSPDDISGLHTLADAYLRVGRLADASDILRSAIKLDPDNAKDYFNLGYILKLMHDKQGAAEAYKLYVTLSTKQFGSANAVLPNNVTAAPGQPIRRIIDKKELATSNVKLPQMIGVKEALDQLKQLDGGN